jgi:two-component system, NtrC family, response regulator PilR
MPLIWENAMTILSDSRILIVDDERDLAEVLGTSLSLLGAEVNLASSGRLGLEQLRAGSFDLVLSDIRMNDGDGIWLCREVAKMGSSRPVVVLLSGFAEVSRQEALDAGAFEILAKPFQLEMLEATVEAALATRVSLKEDRI